MTESRRVVVTGTGVVTPIGRGICGIKAQGPARLEGPKKAMRRALEDARLTPSESTISTRTGRERRSTT